jgi:hypothetical protein
MIIVEDVSCQVCCEFCESVQMEMIVPGCYQFVCPECGEENVIMNGVN